MSFSPIVARRRGCQLATTAPVLLFTWAIALCYELFIVARRRESQLATTAPVLLFTYAAR